MSPNVKRIVLIIGTVMIVAGVVGVQLMLSWKQKNPVEQSKGIQSDIVNVGSMLQKKLEYYSSQQ